MVLDSHIELVVAVDNLVKGCNVVAAVDECVDLVLTDNYIDVLDIHLVDNWVEVVHIQSVVAVG